MRALTASLRSPGLRIRALSCCNGAAESSRRIQSRGASQSAADVYKRLLWWRSGATATNGRLIFGTVALFAGAFGAASASALVLLAARSERGLTDELERQRSAATRGVRTVTVAARVALDYKTSLWGFDDHKSPAYKDALAACHRRSAQRLLELCRTQAGVRPSPAPCCAPHGVSRPKLRRNAHGTRLRAALRCTSKRGSTSRRCGRSSPQSSPRRLRRSATTLRRQALLLHSRERPISRQGPPRGPPRPPAPLCGSATSLTRNLNRSLLRAPRAAFSCGLRRFCQSAHPPSLTSLIPPLTALTTLIAPTGSTARRARWPRSPKSSARTLGAPSRTRSPPSTPSPSAAPPWPRRAPPPGRRALRGSRATRGPHHAARPQVHRAELKLQGEEQLVEVAVKVANEPGAPAAGALPAAAARAERAESDGQPPPPPRACRAACRSPSGTACGRSK